jgi:hypothetical protein
MKDMRAFLRTEVTGWDFPGYVNRHSYLGYHCFCSYWGIPSHPDNSDVTGAIRKTQISNYGEYARISVLCVHFLICLF